MSYKWVHSDGSPGNSDTIKVPAGTPQTVSDTVTATSDNYSATDTLEVTAAAAPAPPPKTVTLTVTCTYPQRTVSSPNITPAGTVGSPYPGATFTASGSEPPYTWSLSVALPWTIYPPQQLSISMPLSGPGAPAAGTVGSSYIFTFTAIWGVSPYTWPASGLPDWLTIDPSSGEITGIPTTGREGGQFTDEPRAGRRV